MKKNLASCMNMIYNNNRSHFMDGVGLGGTVGQGLVVLAMDRLDRKVSRRKQVQDVGAGQGLVQSPFCGTQAQEVLNVLAHRPHFF